MFAQSLWGGGSPFERAISALTPLAWYRFRDTDFSSTIEDSSGNNYDLTKQIATAARSVVATRTTHPGGAYFPAVTFDNWATQGTFYKGTTGLLSGVTQYTALVSFRMIAAPTSGFNRIFGVGTENVAETGTNDLVFFKASNAAPTNAHYWKHRSNSGGLIPVSPAVTELFKDGVNRLLIVRYAYNSIYRMTSSKPGHEALTEGSADAASGTGLDAIAKALVLNARGDTNTGSSTTPSMVIDQIALFSTDIGATAETNLHSLWMDEVAAAGYYPSMMQFDGSTGRYSLTADINTVAGWTVTGRFIWDGGTITAADGFNRAILLVLGSSGRLKCQVTIINDETADSRAGRLSIFCVNAAGTTLLSCTGTTIVSDAEEHTFFCAYDPVAGTAVMHIDGGASEINAAATGHVLTTGTIETGSGAISVGARAVPDRYFNGRLSSFGLKGAVLTNYTDFMDGNLPKAIDEKNWAEWDGRSAGDIGMTQFDGSTGYYSDTSLSVSGNKFTCVIRVKAAPHAGSGETRLFVIQDSSNRVRCSLDIGDSSHADSNYQDRLRFAVQNSAGTNICRLFSNVDLADSQEHMILVDFDGDAGTGNLYIDEVSAINAGATNHNAPTTGTLPTASPSCYVGATGTPANYFNGSLGYLWYRDTDGLSVSDFMDGSTPNINLDDVNWTQFGGVQPQYGSRTGEMTDNKGSAGAMTANGTIKPPRPAFWSHTGQMDNNKGSAGDMTANGTITMTEGGSP